MTKTEKLRRARKVRRYVSRFVDLQSAYMREHVKHEWGTDPDYSAMNHLLFARNELNALIDLLKAEGYGQ